MAADPPEQPQSVSGPAATPAGPTPVFIIGAERSGTTMFRLMLAEHPKIAVCSAFEYLVDLLAEERVSGSEDISVPGSLALQHTNPDAFGPRHRDTPTFRHAETSARWPDPRRAARSLLDNWIFQSHGFTIDPSHMFPQMADSFLLQTLAHKPGATQFMALVHRHVRQLLRLWPDAKFIHMLRDPRDVAKSVIGMGWAGNTWHGIRHWIEVERECEALRDSLPAGRWTDIRYEDLVRSPQEELQRVCTFLGMEFDPRMLEFHRNTTYGPPDARFTVQWKRAQTPRQVALVEARIGSMLTDRGYEPSGHPVRPPSRIERAALTVQDKVARLHFRIRRYGLGLFLAETVSRRVRLHGWHQRTRERMHQIWKDHLR